jgi:drug/metabolite transporter (DMT)-like permease
MVVVVFSPTADGVIAALLSPLFMTIGFFIWDVRWTASGGSAFALNMYKCSTASVGFIIMCLLRGFSNMGISNADVLTANNIGFLLLSSTLGIIIGDLLWLEALRLIGAKNVIVIDSIKPFAAAILGRIFLQEDLKPPTWGGMILTVLGVGIVSWEEQTTTSQSKEDGEDECDDTSVVQIESDRPNHDTCEIGTTLISSQNTEDTTSIPDDRNKRYWRGYTCAFINVLADSFGSLLTKQHGVGMTTWTINLLRFGFAGIILLLVSFAMRLHRCYRSSRAEEHSQQTKSENKDTETTLHIDESCNTLTSPPQQQLPRPLWYQLPSLKMKGWLQITAGVALVTFLCPAFDKFALFQITLALAISLSSVGPLYGLLLEVPFKGKKPTTWGCLGACLAIAGVVVLSVFGH